MEIKLLIRRTENTADQVGLRRKKTKFDLTIYLKLKLIIDHQMSSDQQLNTQGVHFLYLVPDRNSKEYLWQTGRLRVTLSYS